MDIRQLTYFIAAAETGHLGRAAEMLHLSQPALTRQIQLLEKTVGADLFTRTPRGVVLTQVGQTLLEDARHVRQSLDLTVERAQRAARGTLGELDLGVFGTVCYDYLPRLLARLGRSHPAVNVTLHHRPLEQLLQGLRDGRLLAAFERRVVKEPGIASEVVFREPAMIALGDCHPLAHMAGVPIAALRNEPLIVGREAGRTRGTVEFCREHGFEPVKLREASDMPVAVILVASGTGSCIIPSSMTNLRIPGVVYRPLLGRHDLSFELYGYRLEARSSPLLDVLLDTVRALGPGAPAR